VVVFLLGSVVGACTTSAPAGDMGTYSPTPIPASSVPGSPTPSPTAIPSLKPCTAGAVTRYRIPSQDGVQILTGSAAFSSKDAWAVGERFSGQQDPVVPNRFALIEHWDGHSWSIADTPNTGRGALFVSVSGVSGDDVWAVGSFYEKTPGRIGRKLTPLVEHWNGRSWRIVPSLKPRGGEFNGVAALGPRDVWTVGSNWILRQGTSTEQTLTEHWDGLRWRVVPSPNLDDGSILKAVSAVSPNDVWAIGASYMGFGEISRSRALVEHWNGNSWTLVATPATPATGPSPGIAEAVAALSPTDVWIGWRHNLLRWNGASWTTAPSTGDLVQTLAGPRSNDLWAGGNVLAHWDGHSWTTTAIKPGLPRGSKFNAIGLTRRGDVFAVGGLGRLFSKRFPGGHQHPFAVRQCAG
jgi:hypothetical protein